MKNIQRVLLRTAAAAAIVGLGAPAFAVDFSANIELDNTYLNDLEDSLGVKTQRGLEQGGRVEFNASGKAGENGFVAGKASFIAGKSGSVSVDDMWFQVGTSFVDVKLGRFEATNLFPTPHDTLVLGSYYNAGTLRGRFGNTTAQTAAGDSPATASHGEFHAAVTVNTGSGLSFELGLIETKQTKATGGSVKGLRPVVSFVKDALTLRAGAEAIKYSSGESVTGFGATASYNFGAVTVNGNAAFGKTEPPVGGKGNKQSSLGLMADTTFGLGGGIIVGKTEVPGAEDYKTTSLYAAYTMPLFDIKGASVTLGASTAKAGGSNKAGDETGMRLRFNYTF